MSHFPSNLIMSINMFFSAGTTIQRLRVRITRRMVNIVISALDIVLRSLDTMSTYPFIQTAVKAGGDTTYLSLLFLWVSTVSMEFYSTIAHLKHYFLCSKIKPLQLPAGILQVLTRVEFKLSKDQNVLAQNKTKYISSKFDSLEVKWRLRKTKPA